MPIFRFLLFLIFISCAQINNNSPVRNIASVGPSTTLRPTKVVVRPLINIISLCGKKFSTVEWVTDHPNVVVRAKSFKSDKLNYYFPSTVYSVGLEIKQETAIELVQKNFNLPYPLLPSLPILPEEKKNDVCKFLENNVSTINNPVLKKFQSSIFTIDFNNKSIRVGLMGKPTVPFVTEQTSTKREDPMKPLLIVFDDIYYHEMIRLKKLLEEYNFNVILQPLSKIPGLKPGDPVPAECNTQYFNECYVNLPTQDYVPDEFISTFIGFDKSASNFKKNVPFIPGLIRAQIRSMQKSEKIGYVFLVGSPKKLAPFYVYEGHYHEYIYRMPSTFIHTDLYYMIPNSPLKLANVLNFDAMTNWLWSCRSSVDHKIRLKRWCDDEDNREWPDPALSAYRPGIYAPTSVVFNYESFYNPLLSNAKIENMVAVGRLPTQELMLGHADPIVSNYINKVEQWLSSMPAMTDNSFATYGGSTDDSWIFMKADTTNFKATYGLNSPVYASEFFVPLLHCTECEYKSGEDVLPEIAQENRRVAWLLNGHGAKDGIQAPFANGDIESHFYAENRHRIGGLDIKKRHFLYPEYNTIKVLENSQTIVGHVFANSCSTSDFLYSGSNELETIFTRKYNGDQKTLGEQLIAMPNAGAMNTILNSDVGFGFSDNLFNQYFMSSVSVVWNDCRGYLGDAYKLAVYNLIRDHELQFQIHNRQFLGLPINPIALAPRKCEGMLGGTK